MRVMQNNKAIRICDRGMLLGLLAVRRLSMLKRKHQLLSYTYMCKQNKEMDRTRAETG